MAETLEQWEKRRFAEEAEWQRQRRTLPWAEKLRISLRMRNDLEGFRRPKSAPPQQPSELPLPDRHLQ